MSVKVEGVIDLPHVNLKEIADIYDFLHFMHENNIFNLSDWTISFSEKEKCLKIKHKSRSWSYVYIFDSGKVEWDAHYQETVTFKDALLSKIREYYPMYKKAMEFAEKYKAKTISFDKEKEKIILEVYDD